MVEKAAPATAQALAASQKSKALPKSGITYTVFQNGVRQGNKFRDVGEAAKTFHIIEARKMPFVIKSWYESSRSPGGVATEAAKTVSNHDKTKFGKQVSSNEKEFQAAYQAAIALAAEDAIIFDSNAVAMIGNIV